MISGASRGIGKAAAQRFLAEGARVFIGGHEASDLQQALAELSPLGAIAGTVCDVSRETAAERLVASAYAFLASDEASFIHGACFLVDGGHMAQ